MAFCEEDARAASPRSANPPCHGVFGGLRRLRPRADELREADDIQGCVCHDGPVMAYLRRDTMAFTAMARELYTEEEFDICATYAHAEWLAAGRLAAMSVNAGRSEGGVAQVAALWAMARALCALEGGDLAVTYVSQVDACERGEQVARARFARAMA